MVNGSHVTGKPGYLSDFILPTEPVVPTTVDGVDLYLPAPGEPAPAVLLVHGMLRQHPDVTPRSWPVYRGYASELARRGVAAAMLDHELVDGFHYPEAIQTVLAGLDTVRAADGVSGDRVAVWAFSFGGPLLLPVMARAEPWLRCVAGTYPLLSAELMASWPDVPAALAGLGKRPFILTTVEHEMPDLVPGQTSFVRAAQGAGADLRHIAVPTAAHGFDLQTPTKQARDAVTQALDQLVATMLQ